MPEAATRLRRHCDGVRAGSVGRPYVPFAIDVEPVRPDEYPGAKAFDDVPFRIELIDGVEVFDFAVPIETVDAEPSTVRDRDRVCFIASDECPDALTVHIDVHRRWWSH